MTVNGHASQYKRARFLKTIICVKEKHVCKQTAQALEHARIAAKLAGVDPAKAARHAARAHELRDEVAILIRGIQRNRDELADLGA